MSLIGPHLLINLREMLTKSGDPTAAERHRRLNHTSFLLPPTHQVSLHVCDPKIIFLLSLLRLGEKYHIFVL